MSSRDFFYTDDLDLTDEQVAITQQTYINYARNYVENYERGSGALEKAKKSLLDPFLSQYRKAGLVGPVLFVGCGSGRDIHYINQQGIPTYGIDISKPLLDIAREEGIESPLEIIDIQNMNFEESSFDGIFCETTLSHVKKADLPIILNKFYKILRPNGIAIVGFRKGTGYVYCTNDKVGGLRYNTSVSIEKSKEIVNNSGLIILSINTEKHISTNRPPFIEIIAIKKT